MTIVLRSDKGSPLTIAELDGNFIDVDGRIDTLEAAGAGRSISSITFDGVSITINFTDATTAGPFALPLPSLRAGGEWLNNTAYQRGHIVSVSGTGFFLVVKAHTTPATGAFDPEATSGGDPLYQQIGGVIDPTSEVQTQTASTWTLALTDAGTYKRCTNSFGCTITVPDEADIDFAVNDEIHIRADTNGLVIIESGGTDVVINPPHPNEDIILPWRGATVTLKKVGANEWDYIGLGTEQSV